MLKRKKPLIRRSSLKRTSMRPAAGEAKTSTPARKVDAADALWKILCDQDAAGLRFRRRQVIGPYVADFVCSSAKLILKLDGSRTDDTATVQWFRDNGYRVLQFPERDVLIDPRGVLDAISRLFQFRLITPNR